MTLRNRQPDYTPKTVNRYVPGMSYASDVVHGGLTRISLGTPTVGDADAILDNAICDDTAASFTYRPGQFRTVAGFNGDTGEITDAIYGRNVSIVGSAAGVTQNCTIKGRDYLGQPIVRTIALNGTSAAVFGIYKWIDEITVLIGASTETMDVGFTDVLGLPYTCVKVLSEELAGAVNTLGTLVAPTRTDPRLVSTVTNSRGSYDPNGTLDSTSELVITAIFDNSVNASGNGGLYGIKEFGG